MTAGELSPVPREARPLQGEPAGLLTRSIAGIIDGLGVVLFLIAVYVGFNGVRFGSRSKHFTPRPGRYLAVIRATDQSQNTADPRRLRFSIRDR